MQDIKEIKNRPFFKKIEWEKLAKKQIEAPFKPKLSGPKDLRYFDKLFTDENPAESIPDRRSSAQKLSNKYDAFTYCDSKLQ